MTPHIPKRHTRLVQHCTTARAKELQAEGWTIDRDALAGTHHGHYRPHIAWKLVKDGEE